MKRSLPFLLLLSGLSVLCGYLLSKASLVGKAGIDLFYKEYTFLKVWWQGALVIFAILFLLFIVQGIIEKRSNRRTAITAHMIAILMACIGLFFTYHDFRHTLTHRLLGERFHIGGYLFWVGWIGISLFYLFQKRQQTIEKAYNVI